MEMMAIVIDKPGGLEVLKYKQVTKPTAKVGQVLVKNCFSGVNYIDNYQRDGTYNVPLPCILGREGSGIVEEIGEGVTDFKIGDRVAYVAAGSYSEYILVPVKHLIKLFENVSLEIGAACLLQGMTATYLVHDTFKVKPSDFVLVPAAAGGTGSLIVQLCKLIGATVIGTVSTECKAQIAYDNGADHVLVSPNEEQLLSKVNQVTNGKGVQVVYDGVGKEMYKVSLKCLGKRGYYVTFGNSSGVIESIQPFDLTPKCLYLARPALFNYIESREEFLQLAGKCLELVSTNKLKIHIHKIYDLKDVAIAHHDLTSRLTMGKLVLKI